MEGTASQPEITLLELQEVTKTYADQKAVDHVSFNIPRQSIFGLLGPNGAGKTTLIRIITNILAADTGEIHLNGMPVKKDHYRQIGYMPEERGLYKKMKVGEQLVYLARLKDIPGKEARDRIKSWMEKFDISDWWSRKVGDLSKGMQQKIQFIATVVHQPQLLILDEPFSGLDPINTRLIKKEIDLLRQNGSTIIFSTHRMEQVEEICDHIVLIDKGQKILEGPVKALKQQFKKNEYHIKLSVPDPVISNERVKIIRQHENEIDVRLEEGYDSNALLKYLVDNRFPVVEFREKLPTLNEIFIDQVEKVGS